MPGLNKILDRIFRYRHEDGISAVGALIVVFILGAIGLGLAYLSAINQETRVQQITSDQAFYSVQAGLEYGLARVIQEGSDATSFGIVFAGEPVSIVRAGGRMTATATQHNAYDQHSIVDPGGGEPSDCLVVDISDARVFIKQLRGITLHKNNLCEGVISINSMTGTSWEANDGEKIRSIQFGGDVTEFSAPPATPDGSGGIFDFGDTPYVINNDQEHSLNFIMWNRFMYDHLFHLVFNFTYDGNDYSKVVDVNLTGVEQANCLTWNTTSARLSGDSSLWNNIVDTTVSNTCDFEIYLNRMNISWIPTSPDSTVSLIDIGGQTIFAGAGAGGDEIDVNYVLNANTTANVDNLKFTTGMMGRNYSVVWIFEDNSSTIVPLDIFAPNQSSCLDVDADWARVDPANKHRIIGLTMENKCSMDVGMTGVAMSWEGSSGLRFTDAVIFDTGGSNAYSGDAASGEFIEFGTNNLYLRNEDDEKAIQYLALNSDVPSDLEFTLIFNMSDGTTKSVVFTPSASAANLVVNVDGAGIGGISDRDLQGITLTNTGGALLILDKIRVSWFPLESYRLVEQIQVGGAPVWSGSQPSDTIINISDTVIGPSETKQVDMFRFDGDMSGRSFIMQFILLDGTSSTTDSFTPPDA